MTATAHDRYVHMRQEAMRDLAHPDPLQQILALYAYWLACEAKQKEKRHE